MNITDALNAALDKGACIARPDTKALIQIRPVHMHWRLKEMFVGNDEAGFWCPTVYDLVREDWELVENGRRL